MCVLGAIASPTDPLAAATIMQGRFNDATALVTCRVVVAAVVVGHPAAIHDRRAHAVVAVFPGRLASA